LPGKAGQTLAVDDSVLEVYMPSLVWQSLSDWTEGHPKLGEESMKTKAHRLPSKEYLQALIYLSPKQVEVEISF